MYNLNYTHCNLKTTYVMTTGLKPFPTFHIITLEILMLTRGTFQQVQTRWICFSFVECAYSDLRDIFFIILRFKMDSAVEKDGTQLENNNFGTYVHVWIIMSSHVFGLCAFVLFTVRWANLYQPHVCQLFPKVWTHNWANFHYIRFAIYVYVWSFWFSICGNLMYPDVVFDRPFGQ